MARASLIVFGLCLCVSYVLAADEVNPSAPNELNLKPGEQTNNNNQQQQQQQQQNEIKPSFNGASEPSTTTDLINQQDNESSQDDDSNNNNSSPFNFYGPPQFHGRRHPFMHLFGNIFDDMRRHRENMERQFNQLEQQAQQGSERTIFSRNGVTYIRTCTVEKYDKTNDQEQQQQQQQQPQQQSQKSIWNQ